MIEIYMSLDLQRWCPNYWLNNWSFNMNHHNKTGNQTISHKTTKNSVSHTDDEITKKFFSIYIKITYLNWNREKITKRDDWLFIKESD